MIFIEQYRELLKAQSTDAANYAHGGRPPEGPGLAVSEWLDNIFSSIWDEAYNCGWDEGRDVGYANGYAAGVDNERQAG